MVSTLTMVITLKTSFIRTLIYQPTTFNEDSDQGRGLVVFCFPLILFQLDLLTNRKDVVN